ncbi:ABC transporter ATP-binding protein [Solwaraspora sp. WMMD937]|uniref:ABC transporter ATP-binding protein n=1 Tax=Solwaraspora sp. WMMD937 TaxID=3016090 RepID=UPI002499B831|nr:ABC transporter ATP-binding protein [Solwaraspora sp. WMMD937]WFE19990.1 ABC transporter ATP-binding protein [Solwaraspora sp. WMMD937]
MITLQTTGLGKRYGRSWALRDCTLAVPAGTVTALVGPNGAGKTTLLHLAVGLLTPTTGQVRVGGRPLTGHGHDLARVAFVAQDKPLFAGFTVAEMLHFGRATNPAFDTGGARARLDDYGIPLQQRVRTLSGGQRTLVALALALGKRAELLLLDEPLADLDPLARTEVMGALMAAVADTGATVVLSSHILADLVDTCDYLLLLNRGRLQVAGGFDELTEAHRVLTGPVELAQRLRAADQPPVHLSVTARQTTALVRQASAAVRGEPAAVRGQPASHDAGQVPGLEELVLAYLRNPDAVCLPAPTLVAAGQPAGKDVR